MLFTALKMLPENEQADHLARRFIVHSLESEDRTGDILEVWHSFRNLHMGIFKPVSDRLDFDGACWRKRTA